MSEFGNYDSMYGSLDYRDAVVLDIGADFGSTARFFFERGAKRVVSLDIVPPKEEWKHPNIE